MPQYLTGEQWTDDACRTWAAGFFDRGGRINLRAMLLTVTTRDEWALHAFRDALGAGDIDPHPRRVGLHVWRVRQPEEIRGVLNRLKPFLNTRHDDAVAALAHTSTRCSHAERNRHILALREQDQLSHAEIAQRVGTTPQVVANVISQWRRVNGVTIHSRSRAKESKLTEGSSK